MDISHKTRVIFVNIVLVKGDVQRSGWICDQVGPEET